MNQELFNVLIVVLTILFTYGGLTLYIRVNSFLEKKFTGEELKTIKNLASITVKYVENIYKETGSRGEVKLDKAMTTLIEMLSKYNIVLTKEEICIHLENAVNEMYSKIEENKVKK